MPSHTALVAAPVMQTVPKYGSNAVSITSCYRDTAGTNSCYWVICSDMSMKSIAASADVARGHLNNDKSERLTIANKSLQVFPDGMNLLYANDIILLV